MQSSTAITNTTEIYTAALTTTIQDRQDTLSRSNHQSSIPSTCCCSRPQKPASVIMGLRTLTRFLYSPQAHNTERLYKPRPLASLVHCHQSYHLSFQESTTVFSIFYKPELTSLNMAKRCSVCDQWIKTTGGTHTCPGSKKTANEPSTILDDGIDQAPLLHSVTSS